MWLCRDVPGSKCCRFPRPRRLVKSVVHWKHLGEATGCLGLSWVREGGGSGIQVAKSCLPTSTVMRKGDGADCSRVQFF
jgi:hypothetical protein